MTTVRLLKNGAEAFPAMFDAMDRAASSISFEMYIIADDETGREFRERLVKAARRGIEVRALVDAWGSWNLPDSFWDLLREAGGLVRWFHPLTKGLLPFRNHRKLLLIDDTLAFIGGLNVSDEYYRGAHRELPWRDNALEIQGPEVAGLRRSFQRMWAVADLPLRRLFSRIRLKRKARRRTSGAVRFLESGPENPMRPVRRARTVTIRSASPSFWVRRTIPSSRYRPTRPLSPTARTGPALNQGPASPGAPAGVFGPGPGQNPRRIRTTLARLGERLRCRPRGTRRCACDSESVAL